MARAGFPVLLHISVSRIEGRVPGVLPDGSRFVVVAPPLPSRTHTQITEEHLLARSATEGWQSGTTAVVAFLQGDRLVVAHAGDSRAGAYSPAARSVPACALTSLPCLTVLSRRGTAVAVTEDHSPSNPKEAKRIERAGAKVEHG